MKRNNRRPKKSKYTQINNTATTNVQNTSIFINCTNQSNNHYYIDRETSPAESTIHLHAQIFLIDNSKYILNIQK